MNKSELIEALASTTGTTKTDAAATVEALFGPTDGIIARALQKGERVQVTGFGTFEARKRSARMGRNPRTGENVEVPASTIPAFKAGKTFKDSL